MWLPKDTGAMSSFVANIKKPQPVLENSQQSSPKCVLKPLKNMDAPRHLLHALPMPVTK